MNKALLGSCVGGLVLLLCASQGVLGLRCWECNSKFDPRCGESDFNPSTLDHVDCDQYKDTLQLSHLDGYKPIYCRKIIQHIQETVRTVRGCGWLPEKKDNVGRCYTRTGTKDIMVTFCHCDTDNCNSGTSLIASLGLATFVLAVTRLF